MIASIRQRLQHSSGQFVKRSFILAVGFAIARGLGLMYSLLLGSVLSAEDYGYVQYSILVGGIIAIGTQPLLQHTLARFVSIHRNDPAQLERFVSTTLALTGALTLVSLAVSALVLTLSGDTNPGALLVFLGLTVYYAYYGVARGFEDSARLSLVFILSNFVQFIALLVVYFWLHSRESLPALAIYGLSYVGPVVFLSLTMRFPLRLARAALSGETAKTILRFTTPIWGSYGLYAVSAAIDIFLLTSMVGKAAAGAYAFNRTLCMMFEFFPTALATLIMPNVAARASGARRLTLQSILVVSGVSVVLAAVSLPLYPWAMSMFFSQDYQFPLLTFGIMIAAQTLWGIHGILSNVYVGRGQTLVEFASRVMILALLAGGCVLLIPSYGTHGAALANIIAAAITVATYPLLGRLLKRPVAAEPTAS